MGKTKTTSILLPRGTSVPQSHDKERKHFDTINPLLSEEHYGKYLIVKNDRSGKEYHNRFYLCHEAMFEFLEASGVSAAIIKGLKSKDRSSTHLISLFPEHQNMIVTTLFDLANEGSPRSSVRKLLEGFSHLLMVFKKLKISITSLSEIDGNTLKALLKDAKKNNYSKHILKHCSLFLRQVRSHYKKDFAVPKLQQYSAKVINDKEHLSSEVSWQLDVYACHELDETIKLVNEYRDWMRDLEAIQAHFTQDELDQHGGIFTLKNLVFSYFENLDMMGSAAASMNQAIRKVAHSLYGIELKVWKHKRGHSKSDREQEAELRKIGEGGFNITIKDERTYAIWLKIITPYYPFNNTILPQYACLNKSITLWRYTQSQRKYIDLTRFNRRIYPTKEVLYPLYLLSLLRSGLNQQPINDWRVWKDRQGIYHIGEDSGMGRLVDGFKSRGNTIQTTALDKQHCRYVDFFCNYLTPLYEHSMDDHFFQYFASQIHKNSQSKIQTWDNFALLSMLSTKKHFFYKHSIEDTKILSDGRRLQKRIYKIEHEQIRKVRNLSEYLQGKSAWERQYGLGHKNTQTGIIYEQTVEFKEAKQHRIVMTMNTLLDFVKGKMSEKENPKLKVFKGPLANCQNPFKPDYIGSKPLHHRDVCTNWRKCLSGCTQCQPVKSVHGPNIMAWRIIMEELRSIYTDPQEWDRMFLLDDQVAKATLEACCFTKEELTECQQKANEPQRLNFIRREVLNSQRSRRLSQEEIEHA